MNTMTDAERQLENEINDATKNVKERVYSSGRKAAEQGQAWIDETIDFVQDHPAKAIGIAVAGGVVLGALAYAVFSQRETPQERLKKISDTGIGALKNIKNAFTEGISDLKCAVDDLKSSMNQ